MKISTVLLAVVAGAVIIGGCDLPKKDHSTLARELTEKTESLRKLQQENQQLQTAFSEQKQQIRTLQQLGDRRFDLLYRIQRIELGRHTGGVNLDDIGGDDGIKVYLRPIDQDGSVIKTAGTVKIQLFDLAADPKTNLIGEYLFDVTEISKQWSSGFLAYHFSFECPWQMGPPAHKEITVRAEFTDYLTGKVLTAQKLCKIKLPTSKPADK